MTPEPLTLCLWRWSLLSWNKSPVNVTDVMGCQFPGPGPKELVSYYFLSFETLDPGICPAYCEAQLLEGPMWRWTELPTSQTAWFASPWVSRVEDTNFLYQGLPKFQMWKLKINVFFFKLWCFNLLSFGEIYCTVRFDCWSSLVSRSRILP